MKNTNNNDENQKKATKDMMLKYLPYIIIIILVIILRAYVVSPIRVNGTSMEPTLTNKELMLLNKIGYSIKGIKRFDIVVIKTQNTHLIKRVIALPNETISYEDNNLYINGKRVEDKYVTDSVLNLESYKLSSSEYFVLGDNRDDSRDSRAFGPIHQKQIIGKTNIVIYPFNKIGKVS